MGAVHRLTMGAERVMFFYMNVELFSLATITDVSWMRKNWEISRERRQNAELARELKCLAM